MSHKKMGIAVAADNIEKATIDRFLLMLQTFVTSVDEVEITKEETFGPYNKSRSVNKAIRQLIQKKCQIIVQTDIDAQWSFSLMEETRNTTKDGIHFWAPFLISGLLNVKKTGSWNALTVSDWLKIGGLDERCFGWGAEDDLLHAACQKHGLQRITGKNHPKHHEHARRIGWSIGLNQRENGRKNMNTGRETNFVNYLTDDLPDYKGVTLHVTSKCNRKCPQCCLQDFLSLNDQYQMSEPELDDFILAVEKSPYAVDRVIICGGEPLLCPLLPQIIHRLEQCSRIDKISLFTGLVEGFDLNTLPHFNGVIRVSRYACNEHLIERAKKSGAKFQIVDRADHIILPDRLYPDSIPGYCMNPEVFIYQGRVYTCPMVIHNLLRYNLAPSDSPLYSEPLTHRFFDRLRGWKTGAMKTCTGCVGNRNFEKITGWSSH